MRIIAKRTLREFWTRHPDAAKPLQAWFAIARKATWKGPADVKAVFAKASIVANNRVVFNIKGNDYRLMVRIAYALGTCWIRFVGRHSEYDEIDVTQV